MAVNEIYVKLIVGFARDPKVRALARYGADAGLARDLYVQMLLYCKENLTDGFVPADEIGVLAYPLPVDHANQLAKQLASVLLTKELSKEGTPGWEVCAFLSRNNSKEEVERLSQVRAEAGRKGGKVSHGGGRPSREAAGQDVAEDENKQVANQVAKQKTSKSEAKTSKPVSVFKDQKTDTERSKPLAQRAERQPEPGSDGDPAFSAFWDAYPRKVAKGQARTAWRTAVVRRAVDPAVIVANAARYRDDPGRRSRGTQFTAYPATWLNGERWLEQANGYHEEEPGDDDFWR